MSDLRHGIPPLRGAEYAGHEARVKKTQSGAPIELNLAKRMRQNIVHTNIPPIQIGDFADEPVPF